MQTKPIRLTKHALEQCQERGATEIEVIEAIESGEQEPAKLNRKKSKKNFQFNQAWAGNAYSIKQVVPVFVEEETEIVVVTVYTYFF